MVRPGDAECRAWYQAHKADFWQAPRLRVRHILIAAPEGTDPHPAAVRAEDVLLELMRPGRPPERFAELAVQLSACASAANGGDLGWIGPGECLEELAHELFHQNDPLHGMGLHPRLVHSALGFHIVEVTGRRQGRYLRYELVRPQIAQRLATLQEGTGGEP